MSAPVTLRAGTLCVAGAEPRPGAVVVDPDSGLLLAAGPAESADVRSAGTGPVVELGERMVVPGFVDVHVHGGAGLQVNGDDADEVADAVVGLATFHARHGTTSLVATTVSDTPERLLATVEGVARAIDRQAAAGPNGQPAHAARIVGTHLEGPFLSASRRGAQDPASLRLPDVAELDRLLDAGRGTVRLVTIAPELEGAADLVASAASRGVVVALGHSDATFEQAEAALAAGARHVTHLFNGMAPFHHRQPGLAVAGLLSDASLEVIADLEHVHPAVLQLAGRLAPGRLVAVSDAAPAAGLPEGRYLLGSLEIAVHGNRVTLAENLETLAGSALTLEVALRNLVCGAGLPLAAGVDAVAHTPSRLLGLGAGLAAGAPGDLVVLEPSFEVAAVLIGGRVVHDPAGLGLPLEGAA